MRPVPSPRSPHAPGGLVAGPVASIRQPAALAVGPNKVVHLGEPGEGWFAAE